MFKVVNQSSSVTPFLNNHIALNRSQVEKPSIIFRTALVAGAALAFTGAAVVTGMTCGLDLVVLTGVSAAAGLVGIIVGIFLQKFGLKAKYTWSESEHQYQQDVVSQLNQEFNGKFAKANAKDMEEIVKIFELSKDQASKQMTDAQLDRVLELVDKTKISITAEYAFDKLYNTLVERVGEERAKQVLQNKDIIPDDFKSETKALSQELSDHIVEKAVTYFDNCDALRRIANSVGNDEIMGKVLAQLDLDEVMKGQRKLGPETEQAIVDLAQVEGDFGELVNRVKLSASTDLFLDDAFIEQKFHIVEKLQDLPESVRQERRDKLQMIINNYYVNRELNNRGKLTTGDKEEVILLEYFGYNVSNESAYFDKDSLYSMIREVVHNQLEGENCTEPLHYVRERMHSCALHTRLNAAGLTNELQIEKFQSAHKVLKVVKEELLNLQKECELKLPNDFPLQEGSLNLKKIRMAFEANKEAIINKSILMHMFSDPKLLRGFKNEMVTLDQFQTYLNDPKFRNAYVDVGFLKEMWAKVQDLSYFVDNIAFFMKWGTYLKAELIQGLDDANECLIEGVCWGNTQRMRLNVQKKADLTIEEFVQQVHIEPRDRFLQGVLLSNFDIAGKRTGELPKNLQEENGYREDKEVLCVKGSATEGFNPTLQRKLKGAIEREANYFHDSNGWASINLQMVKSGHATLMRLLSISNLEPHYAWFADPNAGLFCFEEGRTFDEARDLFTEFFKDLVALYYSDTYLIKVNKLVEK